MDSLNIFRALSDDTRFRIICCLLEGELCACVIPQMIGRAQPTVSLQLKKLVRLGVLASRRSGKMVLYRIKDRRITLLLKTAGIKPPKKHKAKVTC